MSSILQDGSHESARTNGRPVCWQHVGRLRIHACIFPALTPAPTSEYESPWRKSHSACNDADTGYNSTAGCSHSMEAKGATMDPLTERQAEILRLIRELTEVSGFPPTRAEIARAMGFRSVNAAEQHLRALEKKGVLEILSGASRGLRVLDPRPAGRLGRLMELPVIGRVAAGSPILAEAHVQGRYQVDPLLFSPRADYLLKVRGMSMRDAG